MGGIKSTYVESLTCVRVKGDESERFMVPPGVKQNCIMSPGIFNVHKDAVMNEEKMGMGRKGVKFLKEGKEWILPGLLYADDLVLCGESNEDLRAMVGRFVEVCRRKGLKINAGKSKEMVINGEDGLECEVLVDGIRLEHVSEFKYLGCVLDE